MTTDIEKQFFEVFGIPPLCCKKYITNCTRYDCENCENFDNTFSTYPQITDRILLELEDILLKHSTTINYSFYDGFYYSSCAIALCNGRADNRKDAFLKTLISIAQNYLDNSDMDGEEAIYKEIQALFKEDN